MNYILLFGSLNVGKQNRIKMSDLKAFLEDMGLTHLQTFLQSGNVLANSPLSTDELRQLINKEFAEKFGFSSLVIVIPADNFQRIPAELPFTQAEIQNAQTYEPTIKHLYVYFFESELSAEQLATVTINGKDRISYQKDLQVLYVLSYDSIRTSPTIRALGKLKLPMTARNWNTVEKLVTAINC